MPKMNPTKRSGNDGPLSALRRRIGALDLLGRKEIGALEERIARQEEQIRMLNSLLGSERKRSAQLALLSEVEQHLKTVLDQPVAAQLVVSAIQRAFGSDLAAVLAYDPERNEFSAMAAAGKGKVNIPPSYRQRADRGLMGRVAHQRKTIIANDTRRETEYLPFEGQVYLSEMVVPLVLQGNLRGILVIDHEAADAFTTSDAAALEIAAEQLVGAWERSNYHQRLTELIQGGIALSTLLDPQAVLERVAAIARKTLEARFTFVTLLDHEGNFTRTASSGNAPHLMRVLKKNLEKDDLIRAVLNADQPLRIRDMRKSNLAAHLNLDQASFKGLLAFPIRLHQLSIGVVLAFGKEGPAFFTDSDESLASLIASQAAAAIESTWLYQELHATLNTATLLYQLNTRIMQAEDLKQAASAIAETAFKLGRASRAGIALYTLEGRVQAQVEVDSEGPRSGRSHPQDLVRQALESGQAIVLSDEDHTVRTCIPLQTPHRAYGALWLDIPEGRWYNARYSTNLQTLVNQATVALERSILLAQTRDQTRQLEEAYHELEKTYDQTLAALTSSLDARDRETEGHSARVGRIACRLGEELGLTPKQVKALERGALLHDIGKIGVSDAILLKPGPLSEEEWRIMHMHPEIGARILGRVPFLSETTPVIRYHHEHWDGSGYPLGLAGEEIPLLARIFAVADAFDAMVSDRPYRKGTSWRDTIQNLQANSGVLFDPDVLATFVIMLTDGRFSDILGE